MPLRQSRQQTRHSNSSPKRSSSHFEGLGKRDVRGCNMSNFRVNLNPPNDSAETDSGLDIRDISSLNWGKWPTERVLAQVRT